MPSGTSTTIVKNVQEKCSYLKSRPYPCPSSSHWAFHDQIVSRLGYLSSFLINVVNASISFSKIIFNIPACILKIGPSLSCMCFKPMWDCFVIASLFQILLIKVFRFFGMPSGISENSFKPDPDVASILASACVDSFVPELCIVLQAGTVCCRSSNRLNT